MLSRRPDRPSAEPIAPLKLQVISTCATLSSRNLLHRRHPCNASLGCSPAADIALAANSRSTSVSTSLSTRNITEMAPMQEPLLHSVVEKRDQRIVIAIVVEHSAGLVMQVELRPGPHLEQLIHRADAPGSATNASDDSPIESLRSVMVLTMCSSVRPAWPTSLSMSIWGITADHATTRLQGGVRQRTHQADAAAAVDERDVAARRRPTWRATAL